jgi:hypothetical protein
MGLADRGRPSKFAYMTLNLAYEAKAEKVKWETWEKAHEANLKAIKEREITVRIDSPEKIQEMLKIAMKNRGINNKAVSEAIKKPSGNTSRLLNSENMQVKTLLQICDALGLKLYLKGHFNKMD